MRAIHLLAAAFAFTVSAGSVPVVAATTSPGSRAAPNATGDQARSALAARVRGYVGALRKGEGELGDLAARPMPPKLTPAERALWQRYVTFAQSAAGRCATVRVALERAVAKAEREPVPVATETLSAAVDDHLEMVDELTRDADAIRASSRTASTVSPKIHATLMAIFGRLR